MKQPRSCTNVMMRNAMHPLSMARDTLNAQHFSDTSFADEIVKGTFAMGYLGDLVGLVTLIFSLKSVAIGWAYSVSFAVVGYYLLWWIMPTLYHDWCFYIQLYVLMPASFLVNLVKCFVALRVLGGHYHMHPKLESFSSICDPATFSECRPRKQVSSAQCTRIQRFGLS